MPYVIRETNGRYCVHKEGEADPIACHDTREGAERQRAALYAQENGRAAGKGIATTRIKSLGDGRVGGYGVVWGDHEHRDLEGDYFTPQTYFGHVLGVPIKGAPIATNDPWLFDHTMADLPLTMQKHGDERDYKMGTVELVEPDDIGLWIEAQRERRDQWSDAVMQLINAGELNWSSGAVSHMVRRADNGWLKAWPIAEWSSTPQPAEPRQTDVIRLKHVVNNQNSDTPQAAPDEGARHFAAHSVDSNRNDKQQEDTAMTLTLNEQTVKALVLAYVAENPQELKAAMEVAQQEGATKNMIAEAVMPLAEQLAELAGTDAETASAYLVEFVSANAMGEPEPEPETPEEPIMSNEPEMLSVDDDVLAAVVQQQVAKAMQAMLPQQPTGKALTDKARTVNVNKNREPHKNFTLSGMVRATAQKNFGALKAMGIDPDTAGGYLVPTEQSNEVIELLRSGTKVMQLCRNIPMASDTLTIPKQTGGATAYWVAENASITDSDPTAGQITLVAKKVAALVKVSNELLNDSDPSVDALIREDIAAALGEKIDNAILEGSGLAAEPTGLINLGPTTTALNAAPGYGDVIDMISRVEVENVRENPQWAFVIHPRERATLAKVQDATSGDYLWLELALPGQTLVGGYPNVIRGYPLYTTTQVSIDTDNNNETRMYFGQWNDVIVGMRKTLEIVATSEGGDSFQYDQTWIRAIMRVDVNIRHDESIEILTDVRTS